MYGFYGINFPHDVKVLTTKGPKCIRDLTPGDMLYEYWTSQLLEVQEVVKSKIQMIWNIRYNDGRRHSEQLLHLLYMEIGLFH